MGAIDIVTYNIYPVRHTGRCNMEQVCPFATNILLGVIFGLLMVWSLVWKGIALWKAGNNKQLAWYICMFIFNTAGILEIIYIFGFSKKSEA
jgi:methionyl-tRNA synthetase